MVKNFENLHSELKFHLVLSVKMYFLKPSNSLVFGGGNYHATQPVFAANKYTYIHLHQLLKLTSVCSSYEYEFFEASLLYAWKDLILHFLQKKEDKWEDNP